MSESISTLERLLAKPESDRRIGPFLLVRQLGRGGFAPVWLAKETFGGQTLRAAAVKIFALDARDSITSRRIIAEASALCRVEHPNVVRFYSLAVDEDLGVLGLGMEFVAGRSLAARLDHAGPMRHEHVVEVGLAIAAALTAVHRAGIVHRDVKPANIMETEQGYKLVDFGISLTSTVFPDLTWAPSSDPECTGRIAALQSGTLGYVDPVMIATGVPASASSDLYALGATLYECLTGQLPASADGKTFDENILDGRRAPPLVSDGAKSVPLELVALIDKLLSPDRLQRYSSAEEVFRALERLRVQPRSSSSSWPSQSPPPSVVKNPLAPFRLFFLLAAIIGFGIFLAYLSSNLPHSPAENPTPAPAVAIEQQQSLEPRASSQTSSPLEPPSSPSTARDKPSFVLPRTPLAQPLALSPSSGQPTPNSSAPLREAASPPPSRPAPSASSQPKLVLPPARDW